MSGGAYRWVALFPTGLRGELDVCTAEVRLLRSICETAALGVTCFMLAVLPGLRSEGVTLSHKLFKRLESN